jgi:putative colanic acid biosynthesis glycosyltransferase WcaI
MSTIHILSQYIWPDGAPTGLYAEQLATRLHQRGCDVRLVGGKGGYRRMHREEPSVLLLRLDHYKGNRGNLAQTFAEYSSVTRAFRRYIETRVGSGDVVLVTSAPPNTVHLASTIEKRGARPVYWLQDYYPELLRGVHEYPRPLRRAFSAYWDKKLARWERVVKIGTNLGGPMENAVVIRNWPTFNFDENVAPQPKTALYSGNLGYGHDIKLLVAACEKLRADGYHISMRADGPGLRYLPDWLSRLPLENAAERLRGDILRHELHLVAANPKITRAIFPSKIWNSIAARRRLICTGFKGEMREELEAARRAPFEKHLDQWMALLLSMAGVSQTTLAAAA